MLSPRSHSGVTSIFLIGQYARDQIELLLVLTDVVGNVVGRIIFNIINLLDYNKLSAIAFGSEVCWVDSSSDSACCSAAVVAAVRSGAPVKVR